MYIDDDDDVLAEEIEKQIAEDLDPETPRFYPPDYEGGDTGSFSVECKTGCGVYPLEDVEILELNSSQMRAHFRCRVCNEIQSAELLLID